MTPSSRGILAPSCELAPYCRATFASEILMKTNKHIAACLGCFIFAACGDLIDEPGYDLYDSITGHVIVDGIFYDATVEAHQFISRDHNGSCTGSVQGTYDIILTSRADKTLIKLYISVPYKPETELPDQFIPTKIPRCTLTGRNTYGFGSSYIVFEDISILGEVNITDSGRLVSNRSEPMSLSFERDGHVLNTVGHIERFVFKSVDSDRTWVVQSSFTEVGGVTDYTRP